MEEPVSIDGSDVPVCKNDAESISQRINTTFLDAVANVRNNKRLKVSNEKSSKCTVSLNRQTLGPTKVADLEYSILLVVLNGTLGQPVKK